MDRNLTKSRVVVFDSLNNIKGYRYELWCITRSAGTRYCMVHVDTPADTCRQWNAARDGDSYSEEIFEDLAGRFERPDARNRWDAPLFTVSPTLGEEHMKEQAAAITAAATANSAAATAAAVAAGASAVAPAGKELVPTSATTSTTLAGWFNYPYSLKECVLASHHLVIFFSICLQPQIFSTTLTRQHSQC